MSRRAVTDAPPRIAAATEPLADPATAGWSGARWAIRCLTVLALGGCTCGDDRGVPPTPSPEAIATEGPRNPRVPPDFDLALPEGAVVRYGESDAERATVLVTVDSPPDRAVSDARAAFEARGWSVRVRASERARPPARWREVLDAHAADAPVASAVVERGAAGLTRIHFSQRLEGGEPFHAPEEPREWRTVDRPPIPAVPGESEPACVEAMRALCGELAEAGGPDAIDCAMDHRNACSRISEPASVARFVPDAEARLRDALRAHDSVGSRGARHWTLAQLRVELLLAKANLARAAEIDEDATDLAVLVAATEAEGVTVTADTSAWFARAANREIAPVAAP